MTTDVDHAATVKKISEQGWLQGHIVPGDALNPYIQEGLVDSLLGGKNPTYWILISHSCTVHARNYDDAPVVEWIACNFKRGKIFGKYLNANNPRRLQLPIEDRRYLELRIERRIWTPRLALIDLQRNQEATLDAEQLETLIFWLSHSYNRIAMPDRLVDRLRFQDEASGNYVGLGVQLDKFLDEHSLRLKSAWVSFNPKHEIDTPEEPYTLAFRFLVKNRHIRELEELNQLLQEAIKEAPALEPGLVLDDITVTPMYDFTMLDVEDFTHYNSSDWLSLGEEDTESEDDTNE
ncbi:hypothetical protein [Azomonas macrocytogenes]|uniref:Uncharacterized protein n=1 Tax=Azomonas macrocytogenes TaxID=69962 RepID=A0A839T6V1_AZOMA|nr:hypothetical protein [Azomonas macrocytogenes]MBB3105172.1 hypothetical protein [Azomonas macrocytogenes]